MSEEGKKGRKGLRELPRTDYSKLHSGEPAVFLEKKARHSRSRQNGAHASADFYFDLVANIIENTYGTGPFSSNS